MTDHASVTRALFRLYPRLPLEVLNRLARELTDILDRCEIEGWELDSLHLVPHKSTPLGYALKKYREAAGIQQKDVALTTGWSISKVVRMESGETGASPTDVRFLLDLYQVKGTLERNRLERLARESNRQSGRRGPRS